MMLPNKVLQQTGLSLACGSLWRPQLNTGTLARSEHQMKSSLFIRPAGPRPDFRLLITFLWSEMHNVDSEGDAHNPASREWTRLYLKARAHPDDVVEVHPIDLDPLVLAIDSAKADLAARVAFFLAREANGDVASVPGAFTSTDSLLPHLGIDFDLTRALQRADASVWRSATAENPYPNLKTKSL
jgi:hypothetical protein